ncbi:YjbH domain-containing protein (plasmid) [Rhodobacteraceae bacterium S2214]|nr:YjbH domain-containing protein [Rhodobacteraceae bacterium S2214]
MLKALLASLVISASVCFGVTANAESISTYGTPGLIDLPSARVFSDGELRYSLSVSEVAYKNTVTFQILPKLYGSFRYSNTDDFVFVGEISKDRSFDLHFQMFDETELRPAIGVGIRDMIGTGIYSSEYVVATKEVYEGVQITGGIGWGRLAGRNSFGSPLSLLGLSDDVRTVRTTDAGGQFETGRWFQGDASLFAGVDWAVNDQLSVQLEYSPDVYRREVVLDGRSLTSPLNFSAEYAFGPNLSFKAFVQGGENFGAQLNLGLGLKSRQFPGGREPAPRPIVPRYGHNAAQFADVATDDGYGILEQRLASEGLNLDGQHGSGSSQTIYVTNNRWDVEAQAAGRAARVLANTLSPEVERFTVVFQERGVPITAVETNRSDLEDLQYDYDAAWRTLARAEITDASVLGKAEPELTYNLKPYSAFSFFDPSSPIRADFGVQFDTSYQPVPGLTFDAQFRYPLVGNLDGSERESDSIIQRVRSESYLFAKESDLEVNRLTAEYIWRPTRETFARMTAGYLENQYGGVSAEVLWSPIEDRFALGAELNYVRQRDFDMLLGFQEYDVVTGHGSVYYDLGNGFHSQLDVGRYLAGDWGGTLTVKREFNNGVKVGGYFTLTDVPFDDFGEGSFDKGLTLEIPLSFFTGQPSRRVLSQKIQPLLRDGGARLNVQNRLYPLVRDYRAPELHDGWGRYLR